ncbi:MAG: hypothetical protein M5R36_07390 [Deltaproteobacteria bacterium]|nr:hypothetical protein [Deltaproteobacteria bacterium]
MSVNTAYLPALIVALSTIFGWIAVRHSLAVRGTRHTFIFFAVAFAHATIHEATIRFLPEPDYTFGPHVFQIAGFSPLAIVGWVISWYLALHWAENVLTASPRRPWRIVYGAALFGAMMALTVEPAFNLLQILTWREDCRHLWVQTLGWFVQTLAFTTVYLVGFYGKAKARAAVALLYLFFLVSEFRFFTEDPGTQFSNRLWFFAACAVLPFIFRVDYPRRAMATDTSAAQRGLIAGGLEGCVVAIIFVCVVMDVFLARRPGASISVLPLLAAAGVSMWSTHLRLSERSGRPLFNAFPSMRRVNVRSH